jgi:AraC-like DNA-binding protein
MIASQLYITPDATQGAKKTIAASKQQLLLMIPDRSEQDDLTGYLKPMADLFFARTEKEAIRVLETWPVHLIIANATTGDHGLCRYVKANLQYAHIPVVELIPRDSFTIRLQSLESGVDAWLEKPVSRHILLAQVENLLSNRARIRQHLAASACADTHTISPSIRPDEALWKRLNDVITRHLSNADLDIDLLARHLHISRPSLYRKIADMSNMTPGELITLIRLNKAAALLALPGQPICDVAKMVGFHTRSGFGKAFLKRFRMTPTEYRQNQCTSGVS